MSVSPVEPLLPVAVDAMGGDHAPEAVVAGAVEAARSGHPVILVGDEARVRPLLPKRGGAPEVVHAPDAIPAGKGPASVRRLPDASVRRVMALVAEGRACGAVSCGDTGAALVSAMLELGTIEGVERPAISTLLPRSDGGRLVLLDSGANVDCRSEHLADFALLGAAHASVLGVARPRIGLLSNGEEEGKGNAQVRAALPLLRELGLDVVGHVEPHSAMDGRCDVLVCDGFVGNVLLKSAEAAVAVAMQFLREEIKHSPTGLAGTWMLRGTFQRFRERVAWDVHGGALLLGVRGPVVIGHGRATPEAVRGAIGIARAAAAGGVVAAIADRLRGRSSLRSDAERG